MIRKIRTKHYLLFTGLMILLIIILITSIKGTFKDYINCKYDKTKISRPAAPETSINEQAPTWWVNNYCSGVNNHIYLSLIIIAIAIGLIIAGFITR